jgi:hypothetical protein
LGETEKVFFSDPQSAQTVDLGFGDAKSEKAETISLSWIEVFDQLAHEYGWTEEDFLDCTYTTIQSMMKAIISRKMRDRLAYVLDTGYACRADGDALNSYMELLAKAAEGESSGSNTYSKTSASSDMGF